MILLSFKNFFAEIDIRNSYIWDWLFTVWTFVSLWYDLSIVLLWPNRYDTLYFPFRDECFPCTVGEDQIWRKACFDLYLSECSVRWLGGKCWFIIIIAVLGSFALVVPVMRYVWWLVLRFSGQITTQKALVILAAAFVCYSHIALHLLVSMLYLSSMHFRMWATKFTCGVLWLGIWIFHLACDEGRFF